MYISEIPTTFPTYITEMKEPVEQNRWKGRYVQEYTQEHRGIDDRWDGLKATMSMVCTVAALIFVTAALALALPAIAPIALVVTGIIALNALGLAGGICATTYYGFRAEKNGNELRELPQTFPVTFELRYFHALKGIPPQTQTSTPGPQPGSYNPQLSPLYQQFPQTQQNLLQ